MKIYKNIKKCRVCHHNKFSSILNLGKQPPANSLGNKNFKPLFIPLHLIMCNNCKLLQLSTTVSSSFLFTKYLWVTGTSSEIFKYRSYFVKKIFKKNPKKKKLLEIASNDGFFLKAFQKKYSVIGIDPAKNLAKKANKNGIKTIPLFFNYKNSKKIKNFFGSQDIIICRNVLPHIENINDTILGIKNLLNKNGKVYIEFHYAKYLNTKLHYDYIYHEHIFYYTVSSIAYLLQKFNLNPIDYFNSPISGGSIVLEVSDNLNIKKSLKLNNILKSEKLMKINSKLYWKKFEQKCKAHKKNLLLKLHNLKLDNEKIYGYGASARSSTILNFCKIDSSSLKKIFDKNSMKNKLFTPGSKIEIVKPLKKYVKKSSVILILAWNFEKEIRNFLRKNCNFKGKLISILPKIKILK